MSEAYYEKMFDDKDGLLYPFSCFLAGVGYDAVTVPPHWHFEIEMIYVLKGQTRFLINGEWDYAIEGDFLLINSREVHSTYIEDSRNTRYIVLRFDPYILCSTPKNIYDAKYILDFTIFNNSYKRHYTANELKGSNIPVMIQHILNEFNERNYAFELAIRIYIGNIFIWILRDWHENGHNTGSKRLASTLSIGTIHKILKYIDEHYSENISAASTAKMCFLSYSHFSREFKKAVGISFTEYINYIRITEAEKLLLTTNNSITSIALDTGFSTSSYFIEQFRKIKNLTPYQFRKNTILVEH